MWLRTTCELTFNIHLPTPFVFMLRPRSGLQQWVAREAYDLRPFAPVEEFTDSYGNLCQRLVANPGCLRVNTSAVVKTADQLDRAPGAPFTLIQNLPDRVLSYLLPSRYCESECFNDMATDISQGQTPGYDQVAAIVDWVRARIQFRPGCSDGPLSATAVNANGQGVCRDLAHIAIALCRSISIPARMVVGYLEGLEPMDLHAWFEAWVGGRWYTFDPTQPDLTGGYVAVGFGRDAADVAIYTQFGPAVFPTCQRVMVERLQTLPDGAASPV